jgi:hypothetical protein
VTWLLSRAGLRVVGASVVMLLVLGLVLLGWVVRDRIAGLEGQVATLEVERDRARAALERSRANELVLRQGLERQSQAISELQVEADTRAARAAEAARQALADRVGERRQLEAEIARLREQAATASACETAWLALRAIAEEGA